MRRREAAAVGRTRRAEFAAAAAAEIRALQAEAVRRERGGGGVRAPWFDQPARSPGARAGLVPSPAVVAEVEWPEWPTMGDFDSMRELLDATIGCGDKERVAAVVRRAIMSGMAAQLAGSLSVLRQ